MRNPLRCFNSSPEVIRLTVMMYVRYPLSLRQVEDLLFERGIAICHETVRFWWNRFGPMFAAEIRKRRVHPGWYSNWRWHLDEVFVKINGETHYLWRAVDHEGELLEVLPLNGGGRGAWPVIRYALSRISCTGNTALRRPPNGHGALFGSFDPSGIGAYSGLGPKGPEYSINGKLVWG